MRRQVGNGVAVVLLLLVGVPTLVGALLDREHIARSAIDLPVPCGDVFAVVEEPDGAWNSTAQDVSVTLEEHRPPKWVRTRVEPNLVYGGSWTWSLSASDDDEERCTVVLLEQGWVRPWPLRAAGAVVGYHDTMDTALHDLALALDVTAEPRHLP